MTQEIKKQETSGAAVPRYCDPFARAGGIPRLQQLPRSRSARRLGLPRMAVPGIVTPTFARTKKCYEVELE
jgi:hypothetical protein